MKLAMRRAIRRVSGRRRVEARRPASLLSAVVLSLSLVLTACDGGPSGPGTMNGVVDGVPGLGAVVLEVTGVGIEGFVGQAGTIAYGAEVSAVQGRHRVVLIHPTGGAIRFGVTVQDLSEDVPIVTVVRATSTSNATLLVTGIEVDIAK